jgi:hypothetical protein
MCVQGFSFWIDGLFRPPLCDPARRNCRPGEHMLIPEGTLGWTPSGMHVYVALICGDLSDRGIVVNIGTVHLPVDSGAHPQKVFS